MAFRENWAASRLHSLCFHFFTLFQFCQSSIWSYYSIHNLSFYFFTFILPFLWYLKNGILRDAEIWSHSKDFPVFAKPKYSDSAYIPPKNLSNRKQTIRMLGNVVQSIKLTDYKSTMADQRKLLLLCLGSWLISVILWIFLWCVYKNRRQTSTIASCKISCIPASGWALARGVLPWGMSRPWVRPQKFLPIVSLPAWDLCSDGISQCPQLLSRWSLFKFPALLKLWRSSFELSFKLKMVENCCYCQWKPINPCHAELRSTNIPFSKLFRKAFKVSG